MNIITKLFLIINNFVAGIVVNIPTYNNLQKQIVKPRIFKNININMNMNMKINNDNSIIKRENESIWFLHEYAIEKGLKELKELKELHI